MIELAHQVSVNVVSLSVFLLTAAIFIAAFGWACLQFTRVAQLIIATNVSLTRELAAIQQSFAKGLSPAKPASNTAVPVAVDPIRQSSEEIVPPKKPKPLEGEYYPYDESLQADLEAIRMLKRESEREQGGLSDEELQAQIEMHKAAGFNEDEP